MSDAAAAPRVAIVTLGCGRNDVDTDQVAGALVAAGLEVADDAADADCVLVNTCTFIEPARRTRSTRSSKQCALGRQGGRFRSW